MEKCGGFVDCAHSFLSFELFVDYLLVFHENENDNLLSITPRDQIININLNSRYYFRSVRSPMV